MLDNNIETVVFNEIATLLFANYSGITVYGEYVPVPSSFPSVSVIEIANMTAEQDLTGATTHSTLVFQVDVYSNLEAGKKSQCLSIASDIDSVMQRFGFRRFSFDAVPNYTDATIYRMTGRYQRNVAAGDSRF